MTNVKAEISNMFNKEKLILFNHLKEYFPVHRLQHETNKQNHYVIKQKTIQYQANFHPQLDISLEECAVWILVHLGEQRPFSSISYNKNSPNLLECRINNS